jgi:hypothetical protein
MRAVAVVGLVVGITFGTTPADAARSGGQPDPRGPVPERTVTVAPDAEQRL